MFIVLLVYALFASVFTTAKFALEFSSPLFLVGSRMLAAGLIILIYQALTNPSSLRLTKRRVFLLAMLGIFNIYLTNIFEFWGLNHLSSSKTCLIYSLSPFLSALFSYLIFNDRLTPKKWAGLCVGFAALLPIMLHQTAQEADSGVFWLFSWAELSVVMATFCSAYGWVVLKQVVTEEKCSPVTANGMSMCLGGVLALIHSRAVETWNPVPISNLEYFLISAAVLILVSNLICYNLYGALLKKYSATFLSLAGFTTPLFAAFFGWAFLKEEVPFPFYISLFVLFAGLLLFYQEEIGLRPLPQKAPNVQA